MVKIASVWGKATKSLFQIEQDYIYQYKPTLNCIRSYRSKEEKRVYRKEYNKEYKEKYKEVLNEKKKENYEKNKDRILEKQKENRKINKDIISEKRKKYYENNKEKYKEKITCDCGSTFIKVSKARHYKTKKHKSFIENN